MKSKKGAIELSINMLVVIIISIVVLAAGITLLYKFLAGAQDLQVTLDAKTEEEIQHLLLQEGKLVALPINKAVLSRGEQKIFGLGVLNVGTANSANQNSPIETFNVLISPFAYIPPAGLQQDNPPTGSWVLFDDSAFKLGQQEQHSLGIMVSVPTDAATGIYLFDVSVRRSDGKPYGQIQKIQIDVK